MYYNPNKPVILDEQGIYLLNLDIPGRTTSWLYIMFLVGMGIASSTICFLYPGSVSRPIFGLQMGILAVIITTCVLRKFASEKPSNILSPDVIFLSIYCVFHFSYIFFYALNIVDWDPEVFWASTRVLPAVSFCLWCLIFFFIGYELPGNKYSKLPCTSELIFSPDILNHVAKTMITLAIIFFWGTIFSVGINRAFTDYKLLVNVGVVSAWGRLYGLANHLGVVGITLYCAVSCLNKQKAMSGIVFTVLSLGYMFSVLMTGDRGGFMQLLVIPVIAFHYFQRKIKWYWLVGMFLSLMFIMAVIGITRTAAVGDIKKIKEEYVYVQEASAHNTITRTLLEFGASIKTVVIAMEVVPKNHSYWYGTSYLESALVVIPNLIPGEQRVSKGLGVWLTETAFGSLERTHGRGGSIVMEAYMNFGYAGIIIFLFLGMLIRNLYEKVLNQTTFLRLAMFIIIMSSTAFWIRNTFTSFIRPPIWMLIIVGLLYLYENKKSQPMYY